MLNTGETHSGDIEDLFEANIPITVAELQDTQGAKNDRGKGASPSVHSRIIFPSDGETCPKGIPSPAKLDKSKAVVSTSGVDKDKDVNLEEEYFEEGDDEIVGTILIIPTEYSGEYERDPEEDYDVDDEEVFSFIRYEDEQGYFLRPFEKQKSHLCPLHINATMSGIKVNKVLVDGRATISLLPERMLMKVGKHSDDLVPTYISVTDFSGLTVKLRHPHLTVLPTGMKPISLTTRNEVGQRRNSFYSFEQNQRQLQQLPSMIEAAE
ncbi:hypothetical protein Ahy_A06g027680 [Arachis hypogaea]|uniref:Aspartic peptidase DDI1-type domain-containing protein n=1 Tax=Arachis hypogaea TaxID=3818 RepID=A0A445CPE5_ARAHY|nr:hypothetical protein Ahy_A06g027680 [Arachis hypogaea]